MVMVDSGTSSPMNMLSASVANPFLTVTSLGGVLVFMLRNVSRCSLSER